MPGLLLLGQVAMAEPAATSRKTEAGRLDVSGYVHVQWLTDYEAGATPGFGFALRRGRIEFQYRCGTTLRTEVEVGADELDLTVKDALLECRVAPWFGLTVGLRKMPFSREELTPISRLLLVERGLANQEFGDRGYLGRDIGLTLEGELFGNRLPLGYAVGVYNGNGTDAFRDIDNAKQFAERLTLEPTRRLGLGISAIQRKDSLTGEVVTASGGDVCWRPGWATVEAEVLTGTSATGAILLGAQVVGAWRFGNLEPVVRVERMYSDLGRPADRMTQLVAGLNWHLHRRVQLKANLAALQRPAREIRYDAIVQLQAGF